MAAVKVKNLWTVFITAFFAVLASLGFSTPAAAAGTAAVRQPAEQPASAPAAAQRTDARTARALPPRVLPRDRSLPPTIKQRITAEAHGSSPSVRHLPASRQSSENDPRAARERAYAADAALVAA
ncbi:DUF6344 domain-containing protein [Streptomyces hebeiensis]